jgi:phosphoadenosine phosphosulfate reductase
MDLEQLSIERLKAASEMSLLHYGQPLIITDSGGKDSSVVKELALRSGIPFEIMHNHTTADAPETVRFVRQEAKRFEDLGIKYTINMQMYKGKRTSMWSLIPQKLMPPTRLVRYCCAVLKETGGAGRFIATGVRWAESASRKNSRGIYEKNGDPEHRIILNNDNDDRRMLFENCRLKSKRTVNPIIDWTDDDVWSFLTDECAPPCEPSICRRLVQSRLRRMPDGWAKGARIPIRAISEIQESLPAGIQKPAGRKSQSRKVHILGNTDGCIQLVDGI